jgi:hypothetical protein
MQAYMRCCATELYFGCELMQLVKRHGKARNSSPWRYLTRKQCVQSHWHHAGKSRLSIATHDGFQVASRTHCSGCAISSPLVSHCTRRARQPHPYTNQLRWYYHFQGTDVTIGCFSCHLVSVSRLAPLVHGTPSGWSASGRNRNWQYPIATTIWGRKCRKYRTEGQRTHPWVDGESLNRAVW